LHFALKPGETLAIECGGSQSLMENGNGLCLYPCLFVIIFQEQTGFFQQRLLGRITGIPELYLLPCTFLEEQKPKYVPKIGWLNGLVRIA